MTLQQDPAIRGLWRSSTAPEAGVAHALIIGVSAYPHLDGGSGPKAPDTANMGQLEVSALAASRLFDWLRRAGSFAGLPVKSCRLHLAPRPDELAEVRQMTEDWYGTADFRALRQATEDWGNELPGRSTEAGRNVALFFYSGHGVEHVSKASVFASDILDPQNVNGSKNALSFLSLWQSVSTYGLSSAFFFIDACRNAPELVKKYNIIGAEILQPAMDAGEAADAIVWLQATNAGNFSYQLRGAQSRRSAQERPARSPAVRSHCQALEALVQESRAIRRQQGSRPAGRA
jgi:hypothetical protein